MRPGIEIRGRVESYRGVEIYAANTFIVSGLSNRPQTFVWYEAEVLGLPVNGPLHEVKEQINMLLGAEEGRSD